jgi:two-component system sensor histidine kinase KdpD
MRPLDEPARPAPDALLAQAAGEGRGRLKIYLGMAPGVGKTFAMLEGARRLASQGGDVAVGVVETHGRPETEALLDGLEMLPRARVRYRGRELLELDLDGALARRPALLLVDELAHSNPPDSRHPKRWQDVEELLRAGIDVHTTLNVQHLEGLTDVVARITGVRVREVVPDRILEEADEVELIDLTPEELQSRLAEGRIYAPYLVGAARESFFKLGNLTALRELALRRTAERVDDQMVGYMRRHAIEGPWPAGERLMVCIGSDGSGTALVRACRQLAGQLQAPWLAVHVERTERPPGPEGEALVSEALVLAEQLGARTERLTGTDLPGAILAFARRHNITQIVIGRSRSHWLREALRRSLVHELVRRSDGIAIHVVTPELPARAPRRALRFGLPSLAAVGTALIGCGLVVLLALHLGDVRAQPSIALLMVAVVIVSALRHGLAAALLASLVAFVAYNFFFTEPHHTLQVEHWHDLVTLVVLLLVGITISLLAGRVREQVEAARARMTALRVLYDFARRLSAAKTARELLHAVVLTGHRLTTRPAMVLLPEGEDLVIRYAWPPEDALDAASGAAARWALGHGEPAGAQTGTLPAAPWHFRPLRSAGRMVGVFGLEAAAGLPALELLQTLDAMLDQAAIAVERIDFAGQASNAAALAETERLRHALLSSVSHDLRTPLTSILGAATALRSSPSAAADGAGEDLIITIQEEAERLDRYLDNLLDITRLEAGALEVRRDWLMVAEIAEAAARRFEGRLKGRRLVRRIAPDLPMLRADPLLLETALVNLIDNAVKHGQGATTIELAAARQGERLVLSVTDDGIGIASEHQPRLFDKFYRIRHADQTVRGTGLGLAICKGLVEAMGGTIAVQSPVIAGQGSRFALSFLIEPQPAALAAPEAVP